jgi:DNA polymerase IV
MRLGEAYGACQELIVIQPRMQTYIDVSLEITEILEHFTDLVEPFSIDEQFLDVTGSLRLFGSPVEIARQIQERIALSVDVRARVGISSTKVLAKTAYRNGFIPQKLERLTDPACRRLRYAIGPRRALPDDHVG